MKSKINILIALNDCLAVRGLVAMLNEHPGLAVVAQSPNFTSLREQDASLRPDIIILESTLNGLDSYYMLQAFSTQTSAAIILYEYCISGFHVQFHFHKIVRGIVHNRQQNFLIHAIYEVHAGGYYHCPGVKKYLAAYPVSGKTSRPLFSCKELQVLQYITEDKNDHEMASLLFSSPHSIKSIKKKMMAKTHTKNTLSLVCFAVRTGIITLYGIILPWLACILLDLA